MKKTFAKELQSWRNKKGFVQKEAAHFLQVRKRTYESWECDRAVPTSLALAELRRRMEAL